MASKVLTGFLGFFSSECYWFSLVGKLYGIYIAYRILSRLWYWSKLYFLSPTLQLAADVKSYGKWAVVTGATDGIGKSYAEQLAKKGMKVVLISRSADKLNNVAKEIAEKYGDVETKCVVADFTQDVSIYSKIQEEIKDLDIGVLVNNVGMSYEHPDYLDTMSDQDLKNIVAVNCFSVVFMSKMVLPKMTDKKKGLIINIASLSAHIACPFLTVYSATKAFVHRFSVSMEQEYKSKGITVQCVSPGFVATKLSKIKKYSFMAPGPDGFVSSALETVGLSSQVSGCFAHDLEKTFVDCAGDCCVNYLTYNIMSKVRAKGLAKKEKKN